MDSMDDPSMDDSMDDRMDSAVPQPSSSTLFPAKYSGPRQVAMWSAISTAAFQSVSPVFDGPIGPCSMVPYR